MLAAQTQPQRREPFTDGPDCRRTGPAQLFLWFYVSIAGSLLLWLSVFDFESGDYRSFLSRRCDVFLVHWSTATSPISSRSWTISAST